jgi:hypothetical protein
MKKGHGGGEGGVKGGGMEMGRGYGDGEGDVKGGGME